MHRTILPPEINAAFIRHRPHPRGLKITPYRKINIPHLYRLKVRRAAEPDDSRKRHNHPTRAFLFKGLRDVEPGRLQDHPPPWMGIPAHQLPRLRKDIIDGIKDNVLMLFIPELVIQL